MVPRIIYWIVTSGKYVGKIIVQSDQNMFDLVIWIWIHGSFQVLNFKKENVHQRVLIQLLVEGEIG